MFITFNNLISFFSCALKGGGGGILKGTHTRLGCGPPAPQPLSSAGSRRLSPWKKDNLQNSKAQSTSFHKSVKELSENNAIVYCITNKPKCLKARKLILRTFINLTENIYYTNLQQLRILPFTLIQYKIYTCCLIQQSSLNSNLKINLVLYQCNFICTNLSEGISIKLTLCMHPLLAYSDWSLTEGNGHIHF